ncbi:MAG: respiratory nitrate reductase subunit gamma [Pseudomonadota bacterium]
MTRRALLLILIVLCVPWGASESAASWLMDRERFHISVHGQTACLDCHPEAEAGLHPDPAAVNRTPASFFNPETCAQCHDPIDDYLAAGRHGGRDITSRKDLENCLACHDPHYQAPASAPPGLDPDRPAREQCGVCHESRASWPRAGSREEACLGCHQEPGAGEKARRDHFLKLCGACHNPDRATTAGVTLAWSDLDASPHANLACLDCHVSGAGFPHDQQGEVHCLACHVRHDEKKAHDAHLSVSCQACHVPGGRLVKSASDGRIARLSEMTPGDPSRVHALVDVKNLDSCRRCHYRGNDLGAADRVLPAKGLICLPCHPATLSLGDVVSLPTLLIFLAGFLGLGLIWLAGRSDEEAGPRPGRGFDPSAVAAALFYDVLLQGRLWRMSRPRWTFHALIFFPMLFRLAIGALALLASLWRPDWPGTWVLLDRNNPFFAFFYDLTGVMILAGSVLILARKIVAGRTRVPGLPRPDWAPTLLLLTAVLTGFFLEGLRIALTGFPAGSEFSFLGRALGLGLMKAADLGMLFSWCWYIHAALWGGFLAYLPFSRMLHIILAPLVLALKAGRGH